MYRVVASWVASRSCGVSHIQCRSLSSGTAENQFVPETTDTLTVENVHAVADAISNSSRLFVLTGAGISTESGIPDYRSKGVGLYATSKNRPIQYSEFLRAGDRHLRYWARNYIGWPRFSSRQPNLGHFFLAELERRGMLHWLVTQNVDRLHHKAGSSRVSELHGCTHDIKCLQCKSFSSRVELQSRMAEMNPGFADRVEQSTVIAPDGDVHVDSEIYKSFKVPTCLECNGMLKPNVVFFGDNVEKSLVQEIYDRLQESDTMLVIGSSLEVYSSYRFAVRAAEHGIPMHLLNIGPTRADKHASLHVHARCGETMARIAEVLFPRPDWLQQAQQLVSKTNTTQGDLPVSAVDI